MQENNIKQKLNPTLTAYLMIINIQNNMNGSQVNNSRTRRDYVYCHINIKLYIFILENFIDVYND